MAKIRFNFSLDGWMFADVEADTLEECKEKLYSMTFEELLQDANGYMKDFAIKNVDEEVLEKTVKVKVTSVDYDITESDLDFTIGKTDEEIENEIKKISDSLPQTFEFEIDVDRDDDIDELVADKITTATDFIINSCEYEIVEEY